MTEKNNVINEEEIRESEAAEKVGSAEEAAEEAVEEEVEGTAEAAEEQPEGQGDEAASESSAEEQESERYMRLMAEFRNYKKRVAREKSDIHAYANEKLVSELLPVLDNFDRALSLNPTDDPEGYAKGMELICTQMMTALGNAGLKEIAAQGEAFDPTKHNAVMMEESEEYGSGTVSKVLQKGYSLNDKVIRPSMVSVVK